MNCAGGGGNGAGASTGSGIRQLVLDVLECVVDGGGDARDWLEADGHVEAEEVDDHCCGQCVGGVGLIEWVARTTLWAGFSFVVEFGVDDPRVDFCAEGVRVEEVALAAGVFIGAVDQRLLVLLAEVVEEVAGVIVVDGRDDQIGGEERANSISLLDADRVVVDG